MERGFRDTVGRLAEVCRFIRADLVPFVRSRLVAVVALIFVASGLTAIGPVALKLIIHGLTGKSGIALSTVAIVVFYALSQWLARALAEFRSYLYAGAERRMARTLSERLFAHVVGLPFRVHIDHSTGALSQTLQNGLSGYQMILHTLVFVLLPVVVELGTTVVILTRLEQSAFGIIFGVAVMCYAVAFTYAAATVASSASDASDAQVAASAVMTDGVLNYETVKYFTAETFMQRKVSRALTTAESRWMRFYARFATNGVVVATVFGGFLTATIVLATREVEAGRMTIGTFVMINTYMLQLVRPMEMIGFAVQTLSNGLALLERTAALLREQPEDLRSGAQLSGSGPATLEFRHISASYRQDRDVLRDVSFIVPRTRMLGIVGTSGAGKTTLVRLMVRLIEPGTGEILLDGAPLSSLSIKAVRESIALVPQDIVLLNESIAENIAFGRAGCSEEDVVRAAKIARLHETVMIFPERYATPVGERGVKLSGGEKQRVSIARAAVKRPRIYVFDEATSSLDSETEREIRRNLRELSRHTTTVVIAHRLSTVVDADEIIVLDDGAVVERGDHYELLSQHGRYAALWEAQQNSRGEASLRSCV